MLKDLDFPVLTTSNKTAARLVRDGFEVVEQWRIDDAGDHSVWARVEKIFVGAYGADFCQDTLVQANYAAAVEWAEGWEVPFESVAGGFTALQIVDDDGELVEDAMRLLVEWRDTLECSAFLDDGAEEGYSMACLESATESMDDALGDELRDLPEGEREDLEDRCDALGLTALDIAKLLTFEGEFDWYVEEGWARFDNCDVAGDINDTCEALEKDARIQAARDAVCDRTLALDF